MKSKLLNFKLLFSLILFFGLFGLAKSSEAATYYMRADGTAANKTAATSCSAASSAISVSAHNTQTFSPDDVIYLCGDGGDFKSSIVAPSSGTNGHPITYANAPGETPVIDLSIDVGGTGWTSIGSGVYTKAGYAYYMTEDDIPIPACSWGPDSTCVNHTGNWFYDIGSGVLYYRPTSGTPANHTIRTMWSSDYGLDLSNRSNITISGLTFNHCWYGIYHGQKTSSPVTSINNLIFHDNTFYQDYWAIFGEISIGVESDVQIYKNTVSYCNSGISAWTSSDTTPGHSQYQTRYSIHDNLITHLYSYTPDDSVTWQKGFRISYWFVDHEGISFQDVQDSQIYDNVISNSWHMGADEYYDSEWWNRAFIVFMSAGTLSPTKGNVFTRNYISGHYYPAVYLSWGDGGFENNVYSYNVITYDGPNTYQIGFDVLTDHNNPLTGMNYFVNNTIRFSHGAGYYADYNYDGNWTVANNIFQSNYNYLSDANNTGHMIFRNNIYNTGENTAPFLINGNSMNYNSWKSLGYDIVGSSATISTDPLFTNGSGNFSRALDFTLQAASPAINAGMDVGLTSDYAGNPIIGLPDIGAYEYVSGGDITPPATPSGLSVQ